MSAASKWEGMPMLGFDVESTGVDPHSDRIVQAALVRINPGHRPVKTTWLVDPGIPIPEEAAAVHGITTDRVKDQATHTPEQMLFELVGQLALTLGRRVPVVTMNGHFDLTMLEAEAVRHGVDPLTSRLTTVQPIVDVLVLDKHADPYRKGGRKLDRLCEVYGVAHTGAHDAAGDALAACRLWPRVMAKGGKKFGGLTLPSLHQAQVGWRKEQADGLRSYFDRQGIVHDGVCGSWPLHTERCCGARAAAGVGGGSR